LSSLGREQIKMIDKLHVFFNNPLYEKGKIIRQEIRKHKGKVELSDVITEIISGRRYGKNASEDFEIRKYVNLPEICKGKTHDANKFHNKIEYAKIEKTTEKSVIALPTIIIKKNIYK